ncbi:hypothetical protein CLOP_g5790 [Closterium sp. NIES-67]|nr:hypothetical protein CLOP_g5790 [Closterium sp. NIES-67]
MARERVQRALALVWCITAALVVTPLVMVHAQPLEVSQVQFLQDCKAAWDQDFDGWSNNPDCSSSASSKFECDSSGMIVKISLQYANLFGPLPDSISNLRVLSSLDFYRAQVTGSIPGTIGSLTSLLSLRLVGNPLSGSIPAAFFSLANLAYVRIEFNQLTGAIPAAIGSLENLSYLSLYGNKFTNSIPASIGNLTNLNHLDLSNNELTDSIPETIGSLATLTQISNQLTGSIPAAIGSMTALKLLQLSFNQLIGSVPATIGSLLALTGMILNNNQLTGSIPATIGSMTALQRLLLYENKFNDSIPGAFGKLTTLRYLYLNKNEFTGSIPTAIGNLTNLAKLALHYNQLTGSIPSGIGNLTSLRSLGLNNNQLSGSIPAAMGSLADLEYLYLHQNQITGSIPADMGRLTRLLLLDLSHNYLTGPLVNLSQAALVDLSSNYLTGRLQKSDCSQWLTLVANCFTPNNKDCRSAVQRPAAECAAFCGVSGSSAACSGHGMCYPDGPSLVPTCSCDLGYVQPGRIICAADGWNRSLPISGPILSPFTLLTKGTQRETAGIFMAKPVTLFAYPGGPSLGCGVELAFSVNFTFALVPQAGTVGSNGFAFVIAAKAKVGKPDGVGYGGVGSRSIAVEFDTFQNVKHRDMSKQHVGLNINGSDESLVAVESPFTLTDSNIYTAWVDYEPGNRGTIQVFLGDSKEKPEEPLLQRELSLCAVLQAGVQQQAFFFGFVASTTVQPFQKHVIVYSNVQTEIPPPKLVQINEQARGLSLSLATYAPPQANPFSRYVSADFSVAANKQDSWRIRDFHTWDSVEFLGWPVKNQNDCNACWAYAVVASVEAAYGIARQQSAPQLSLEPLFAAMGLTGTDKCTAGGSPTEAFEKLVTLDSGNALTGDSDQATRYPVQAFERALFKGYVGLMLAVQRQPVVVHIEASADTFVAYDGTFKYQDPQCYTGSLNHVVLVIGYFIMRNDGSQNRIPPPFWIIRNSWGEEWGDRGHMRMDIQGGDGVCGINVLPGIYPIVKIPGDPCGNFSYKGDGDFQPSMNPCGRFACKNTTESSNNCSCSIPQVATQPFVEVENGYGSNTCAYVDVCGSYFKNPCAVGTCINDGKGAYSCICPPNYIESTTAHDFPTCDPVNTTATTVTVSGDNWLCSDVHALVGLSLSDFALQNAATDCSQPLPKGSVLQLVGTPATPCTAPP